VRASRGLRIAEKTPPRAARPVPTTIAIGVARPKRARTGDDEDGDGIHQRVRKFWRGSPDTPRRKGHESEENDRGDKPGRHAVGQAASRGARLLWAWATRLTIRASRVPAPTRSARMTRLPAPFCVPPVTRSPTTFSTGKGSPVIMDSSDGRWHPERPFRPPRPSPGAHAD